MQRTICTGFIGLVFVFVMAPYFMSAALSSELLSLLQIHSKGNDIHDVFLG